MRLQVAINPNKIISILTCFSKFFYRNVNNPKYDIFQGGIFKFKAETWPKLGPITVGIGILGGFRDENLILTCPLFLFSLVPVISLFESASDWLNKNLRSTNLTGTLTRTLTRTLTGQRLGSKPRQTVRLSYSPFIFGP